MKTIERFGSPSCAVVVADQAYARHPDYPHEVWLSDMTQPCEVCNTKTRWRSQSATRSKFAWGHAYVCGAACLLALKLEGKFTE